MVALGRTRWREHGGQPGKRQELHWRDSDGFRKQEASEAMSSPGGGCAACQLLQGACGTDCLFAPHFPAGDDPARFAAVHAAFGADSVARFLSCIPQVHRAEAVHWLVVNTRWRLAVASTQQPSAAAASGGGTPPCAACRHLQITCVFAPHFPASDDPARFAAVNARFGTSHVALILCGLSPAKQAEAARSFVRQAQHPTAAAGPPAPPLERRPPCSACKHFRKKCEPDCVFWPHYPPDDDPKRFAAVHAVYGARNMARHLRDLPPELRGEAATWSAYEARVASSIPSSASQAT
ncbi:hypothetical protein PR202_ga28309 [Eleusine coracana subsp. coracana]|uniref:LOB domain-containing protein n=1 Tax=Eleusine coracana subsp. coracana TaxID=191504 RepID=A0AAV5DIG8_ELECO|nr:hypothetical protein PR202_ga28309 [Eleusine coracana subsp. coracana]